MSFHKKNMLEDKQEYFGMSTSDGTGLDSNKTSEPEPFDIEETVEKIELPKNLAWLVLWIALGGIIGASVFMLQIVDAIVALVLLIGSVILSVRVKGYEADVEKRHYMRNLSHTLKAFFIRVTGFQMFYVNRKRNVIIAAVVLFIEQPLLRVWLYYPVSATIHYIALIVLVLSLLCVVGSKEVTMFAKLTSIVGVTQAISMFLIFIFFQYLAIETILIAVILAVASSWSRHWINEESDPDSK